MELIKSHRTKIAGALLLLTVIVCMVTFKPGVAKKEPIIVSAVKVESVQTKSKPSSGGKLEAYETSNIVSKTTGKVGAIRVDIGSSVNAGDVLLTLEANDLVAGIGQAQAAVQLAYSNREQAQIDYEVQKLNYNRNKNLLDQGALSLSDFDNKIALPFKKAEELALHGSDAQLKQAEATLQLAQANYANCIITSPINGIVTSRNINVGELAGTSLILVSISNLDKVIVMASVEEGEINRINAGVKIPVKVEAASQLPFMGTVTNVAQAASSTTKAFLVKIQIDNPDHILKPGMFAEVSWMGEGHNELAIPREALVNEEGRTYVWTINDSTVSKKEVVAEALDETRVGIKGGLSAGQEVVSSSLGHLKEGIRVDTVKR